MSGIRWLSHLPAPLVGCWYLDDHIDLDRHERTGVGQLVYRAKTYDGKPGDRSTAEALGEVMQVAAQIAWDRHQFALKAVNCVVPVPAFPPKEPFNLPDVLAERVGKGIGVIPEPSLILKHAETPPAKDQDARSVALRIQASYRVTRRLHGERVLLVDDLIHNGTTLASLARLLQAAGSGPVGGFVATRARRGKQ